MKRAIRGTAGGAWDDRIEERWHGRAMRAECTHSWGPMRGIWNKKGRGPTEKIPMLWGHWRDGENLLEIFTQAIPADYDGWLIMFNEPADEGQANMPPDRAAAEERARRDPSFRHLSAYDAATVWALVAYQYPKARLTSPQMLMGKDNAPGEDYFARAEAWLRRWWAALPEAVRPRVEAWAWHCYHSKPTTAIDAHGRWMQFVDSLAPGREYWVTEWGVNSLAQEVRHDGGESAVRTIANYLDGQVDRHMYFMPMVDEHSGDWWPYNLFNTDSTLTGCGRGWVYDGGGDDEPDTGRGTAVTAPADVLANGSFEGGWRDHATDVGYLINQEPAGWGLSWVEQGEALYDSGDVARGVPECVHKLASQLPPSEQLGAKNALILDGNKTYKIFHFGSPFGAELRQVVTGLRPGTTGRLIVPIQVHLHDETDPYGAESGAWVDTVGSEDSDDWEGRWVHGHAMGDRKWYEHIVDFVVPPSGVVKIIIRVKSKWPRPKDFFLDDIRLDAVEDGGGSGSGSGGGVTAVAVMHTPLGYTTRVETGGAGREIVVRVPEGVRVDFVGANAG